MNSSLRVTSRLLARLGITAVLACFPVTSAWGSPRAYLKRAPEWFKTEEARGVAENVVSFQSELGGWPKNVDTAAGVYAGVDRGKDLAPTFDNGATTDELRFLAKVYEGTKEERYKGAFLKGYDYILGAQYGNGGWPQYWPARGYSARITFNDNSMVRLMEFLRETYSEGSGGRYGFLDEGRVAAARKAFEKGVECILRCQIRVDGKLTAWCAQHDEKDFMPAGARSYELPSLSGGETAGIVRMLMSLEKPSPEVVAAVDAAVGWLEAVKITGYRQEMVADGNSPSGRDKRLIPDAGAPALWARFYEIGTNRPFFCDRDGVKKYSLAEIGYERRNGYSWLSTAPGELIGREYPGWKGRVGAR